MIKIGVSPWLKGHLDDFGCSVAERKLFMDVNQYTVWDPEVEKHRGDAQGEVRMAMEGAFQKGFAKKELHCCFNPSPIFFRKQMKFRKSAPFGKLT